MKTMQLVQRVLPAAIAGTFALTIVGCGKPVVDSDATRAEAPLATAQPAEAFTSAVTPRTDEAASQATDRAVAARVKAKLSTDMRAQEIEVSVNAGVANLYGAVTSGDERAQAEQIAAQVPGVRTVNSNLVVVKGS